MDSVKNSRGFVTIATGNERYYRMAVALLHSYRLHARDNTPFAILCDRENEYTREFDTVVVMEHCHSSYMDKLQLGHYSPYEESIFIDADALFLKDPSVLWEDFRSEADFSCYGKTLPTDSMDGWYDCSRLWDLTAQVNYGIQMHGGLYYFRKTDMCRRIFDRAIHLANNFFQYGFLFCTKPADEPVLALSMALAKVEPCPFRDRIAFVPSMEPTLRIAPNGKLLVKGEPGEQIILHFANANTKRFMYRFLLDWIETQRQKGGPVKMTGHYWKLKLQYAPMECKIGWKRLKHNILRQLHDHLSPEIWGKLRQSLKGR